MELERLRLPASKCIAENATIEIEITGLRVMQARIWLGCKIVKLGAWVMGVNKTTFEVER